MNPFKSDLENNAFLSEEDKQEMIRIRDERPLRPADGKRIVDYKNDCIWIGTKKTPCSRDISKTCTPYCPLVSIGEEEEQEVVYFNCGCEEVTYNIDGVIE